MILKNKNRQTGKASSKGVFINLVFIRYIFFIIVICSLAAGTYLCSKNLQTKGYDGLIDFIKTISSNYWNSRNANAENISIEIKQKDIKKLEKNRAQALERGVIINDIDGDYVPATLEYQHKKIKIKLRLKGHMTDHLQDNKWSFRIKTEDNDTFMGMKRFSIQHPGTRGYVYEWIYHELMKREDIIALRYKFITVMVNGKDWGVYAVEENFDQELITHNNRKKGPIIRFNPDLYWVDRYNEIKQFQPLAEFASYYSSNTEAYREKEVLKDSTQRNYYLKAMALLEGFRCNKLSADLVFDIPRMAKFHAIIDLVGGQHSIDWSDLKYYYNPTVAKLEPVAYESFTVFPFQSIAGNYKYTIVDSNQNFKDIHTALFSNPIFFKAYIKELKRVSDAAYLNSFFEDEAVELKNNLAILYKEFPYKKFEPKDYYDNQLMIKQLLNAPKSFHAYLEELTGEHVCLQLGAIESLPVEIKSVKIGNLELHAKEPIILPAKQFNEYVVYKKYCFQMPSTSYFKSTSAADMMINYSLLGSTVIRQERVFPFPYPGAALVKNDLKNKKSTVTDFPFLITDEKQKTIRFAPGAHQITSDLIIPPGYKVIADELVSLDLMNGSKIISYSSIIFSGTEDASLTIQSSDSTGQGIELISAPPSVFMHVLFKSIPEVMDKQWERKGYITCYESTVEFNACRFYDSKARSALEIVRSDFTLKECLFQNMKKDALNIDYSKGTISKCVVENCEKALSTTLSRLNIRTMYVNGASAAAFYLKDGSQLTGWDIKIKRAVEAIHAEGFANVDLTGVSLTDVEKGFLAHEKSEAAPVINLSELNLNNVKQPYIPEKKAIISVDGKIIENAIDN
jgi:hypothetical protein